MTRNDWFRAFCHRQTKRWSQKAPSARLWQFMGLVVTVLLVAIALAMLIKDSQRLLTYSFRLDPLLVLLSFVVECSGLPLAVSTWRGMLARVGGHSSYRDDFRIYCYSMLGIAIPGGFWPLVSRAVLYKRQGVAGVRVAAASVVESVLIGLAGLVVYSLTTTLVPSGNIWQHPGIAWAIAALTFVLVQPPIFNCIIGWLLRRLRPDDELPISLRYTDLGRWLVIEGIVIVIGGGAVYLLLRGFTMVSPGLFFPVISAWAVAAVAGNLLFWVPATSVIRDGAMTLILMQSLPTAVVILFVLLVRVWTIASILIVAALAWLFLRRNRPQLAAPPDQHIASQVPRPSGQANSYPPDDRMSPDNPKG